jgi:coenzyme F420-reducing hydrogenase beta subunit
LKIDSERLEQMMLDVMQEVQPKVYDLQDHDGKWCRLRITPYRTLDNRIEGVVLTVLNKSDETEDANNGSMVSASAAANSKSSAKKTRRKNNHSQ